MSGDHSHSLALSPGGFLSRRPSLYRLSLVVLGWLGHVWVVGLILLLAALAVYAVRGLTPETSFLSVPIILLAVLATLFLMGAARVRIEPPDGVRLDRRVAPLVHDIVDALRNSLNARPLAGVLLGTGMDVRTVRVPRLAALRGFDTYLVIGLPAMLALPLDHLRALIAHELVHHSRRGRVRGSRVHRLRDGWLRLLESLGSGRRLVALPLRPFFRWYAPRFAALSLEIARDHELAADRRAALVTKRDHLAGALIRLRVVERFLVERFHPRLLADMRRYGVPPTGLDSRLERAIEGLREDPRFAAWVDTALNCEALPGDPHPPLRKRLSALALADIRDGRLRALIDSAFSDEFVGESSARLCLAALPKTVMASIENAWVDEVQDGLSERHEELLRMEQRRRELNNRSELSHAEELEQAIATAETGETGVALSMLGQLAARRPDMAPARFVLGTLLLREDDAEGLAHIYAAIRIDPDLEQQGRELAGSFLRAHDRLNGTALSGAPTEGSD